MSIEHGVGTTDAVALATLMYKACGLPVLALCLLVAVGSTLHRVAYKRPSRLEAHEEMRRSSASGEAPVAWNPNVQWIEPSSNPYIFGFATVALAGLAGNASLVTMRAVFTALALAFLAYRVVYYAQRRMILYVLDLCYWVHACALISLWLYSPDDPGFPQGWDIAVFASVVGPVAGASFMLQQPLLVHHPEAFESFFLHIVPMWMAYAVRWRLAPRSFAMPIPLRTVAWLGLWQVYMPWAVLYTAFLLAKPYLPAFAKHETLFDWYLGSVSGVATGGSTPARPTSFFGYAWKPVFYIVAHALFSLEGYCAAAICYQSEPANLVWLAMTFLGTVKCSYHFYRACYDPAYQPGNKLISGLKDSAMAWLVLLPTYWWCCSR